MQHPPGPGGPRRVVFLNRSVTASEAAALEQVDAIRHSLELQRLEEGRPAASSQQDSQLLTIRSKLDSRVAFAQTTLTWLPNALLALSILFKLNGAQASLSWWATLWPAWVSHVLLLPFQLWVLASAGALVDRQIGPPPPPALATPGLALQHGALRMVRCRAFQVDTVNSVLDALVLLVAKVLFCVRAGWVERGNADISAFRVLFIPFCIGWVATSCLNLLKARSERVFGSARDLQFLFLLFVAFKLDGRSSFSWRIVFLVLWLWFVTLFVLALVLGVIVLHLRARGARLRDMLLPLGFLAMLAALAPQCVAAYYLAARLDGDASATWARVLLPSMVSWFAMWAASGVLAAGLRQKELERDADFASGAFWERVVGARNAPGSAANRGGALAESAALAVAQRKVDAMSEAEIAALVHEAMQGKAKPLQLVRVGQSLYRRLTAQLQPEPGTGAGGGAYASMLAGKEAQLPAAGKAVAIDIPGVVTSPDSSRAAAGPVRTSGDPLAASSHLSDDMEAGLLIRAVHTRTSSAEEQPTAATLQSATAGPSRDRAPAEQASRPPQPAAGVHAARSSSTSSVAPPGGAGQQCAAPPARPSADGGDDALCIICYDAAASCVFLECGHGGVCQACAFRLYVRPPGECPTCRTPITQVVEVAPGGRVGDVLPVLQ